MIKDIEPISKISKVKLRLHKRLTMRGLYYREMAKRIENSNKKKVNINSNEEKINSSYTDSLTSEGNLFDKLC